MVRELAHYQVDRYATVFRWDLGEALAAYEARMREQARHDFEMETLVWAVLAQSGATKSKAPEAPSIMRD